MEKSEWILVEGEMGIEYWVCPVCGEKVWYQEETCPYCGEEMECDDAFMA